MYTALGLGFALGLGNSASFLSWTSQYAAGGVLPSFIQDGKSIALPAYGPEVVPNGRNFTNTTGWVGGYSATLSAVGGNLRVTSTGTVAQAVLGTILGSGIPFVAGKLYEMTARYVARSAGSSTGDLRIGTANEGFQYVRQNLIQPGQTARVYFTPANAFVCISLFNVSANAGETFDWTDISIREVRLGELGTNLGASGYTMSANGGTGTATESPTGTLNLTGDGTNGATADKQLTGLTVGTHYRVVFLQAGAQGAFSVGLAQGGSTVVPTTTMALGVNHFEFTATATTMWVRFIRISATLCTVSSITVAEWTPAPTLRAGAFSDAYTFTNGSGAAAKSRTDRDGLLKFDTGVDQPRWNWDATRQRWDILLEGQSTNLITRSAEFNDAAWSKTGCSAPADAAIAPDGTLSAEKIVEDTSNGQHRIQQNPTLAAGAHTLTVYAKAGERSLLNLEMSNGANGVFAIYDLALGTVNTVAQTYGTGFSAPAGTIVSVGNGWYRLTLNATVPSGVINTWFRMQISGITYAGDGTSGLFLWGAQLEALPMATSYIPTGATTVTRLGDRCEASPLVTALYNLPGFTADVQGRLITPVGGARVLGTSGAGGTGALLRAGAGTPTDLVGGSTTGGLTGGSNVFPGPFSAVVAANSAGRSAVGNGRTVGTDTGATDARTAVFLARSSTVDVTAVYGDGLYSVHALWPARLSDALLHGLSAPPPSGVALPASWFSAPQFLAEGVRPAFIRDGNRVAMPSLGPELATNGDFSAGATGWNFTGVTEYSISGGTLNKTGTANANAPALTLAQPLQAGKLYRFAYRVLSVSGGAVGIRTGGSWFSTPNYTGRTVPGSYEDFIFVPSGVTSVIVLGNNAGVLCSIDDISVREVMLGELGPNLGASGYTPSVTGTGTATESPSGTLNLNGGASGSGVADRQLTGLTVGRHYRIVCLNSATFPTVRVGTTQGGVETVPVTTIPIGVGHFEFIATATSHWVRFANSNNAACVISSITIAEWLPGPTLRSGAITEAYRVTNGNNPGVRTYTGQDGLLKADLPMDTPRFTWDATRRRWRWVIEGQGTNLLTRSSDLSVDWSTANLSIGTPVLADPGGSDFEALVTEDSASTGKNIGGPAVSFVSGTTYTFSVSLRYVSQQFVQLTGPGTAFGFGQYATFDLVAGTVHNVSGGTATITRMADGRFRCTFTLAAVASLSTAGIIIGTTDGSAARLPTYLGAGRQFRFCRPQCEAAPAATSYIPTTTAAVTRLAENVDYSDLIYAVGTLPGGTAEVDAQLLAGAALTEKTILGGGSSDVALLRTSNAAANRIVAIHAAGAVTADAPSGTLADRFGAASSWNSSAVTAAVNGVAGSSSAAGPPARTKLTLGRRDNGLFPGDGLYDTDAFWPFRVANANLPYRAQVPT